MLKQICLFFAVICPTFAMATGATAAEQWREQLANQTTQLLIQAIPFQQMTLAQSVFESQVDDFLDRHGLRWEMNVNIFTTAVFECFDAMIQSCRGNKNAVTKWHALLRFITEMNTDFLERGIESKLAELFKQINCPQLIEKEIKAYFEFCRTKEPPPKRGRNLLDLYSFGYSFKPRVDLVQNCRREHRGGSNLTGITSLTVQTLKLNISQIPNVLIRNPINRLLEPSAIEFDQRANLQWQRARYIQEGMEFWQEHNGSAVGFPNFITWREFRGLPVHSKA